MVNEVERADVQTLGMALQGLAIKECRSLQRALSMQKKRQDGIHSARKSCRRLRSLLQFLPDDPQKEALDKALKQLIHSFSPLRDAYIAANTAQLLAPAHTTWLPAEILEALKNHSDHLLGEALNRDPDWRHRRVDARHIAIMIDAQYWQAVTASSVKKILRRSHRGMNRARNEAQSANTAAAYHKWRRRTRNLRYQLELLRKARHMAHMKKRRTKLYGDRVKKLVATTDHLGWRQDFEIFREAVDRLPSSAKVIALRKALQDDPGAWPQPKPVSQHAVASINGRPAQE